MASIGSDGGAGLIADLPKRGSNAILFIHILRTGRRDENFWCIENKEFQEENFLLEKLETDFAFVFLIRSVFARTSLFADPFDRFHKKILIERAHLSRIIGFTDFLLSLKYFLIKKYFLQFSSNIENILLRHSDNPL